MAKKGPDKLLKPKKNIGADKSSKRHLPKRISRLLKKHLRGPSKALVVRSKQYNEKAVNLITSSSQYHAFKTFLAQKPFYALVVIPWLIMAFYIVLIKSPIYESTSKILIEKNGKDSGLMINLGFLGQAGSGSASDKNTLLTMEYITSRDALSILNDKLHLKEHYQSKSVDFISRLKRHPKENDFIEYYQSMVEVSFDSKTSELTIFSRAYQPKIAYQQLKEIILESKLFANKISNSFVAEQYKFAEQQLQRAKEKLYKAEQDVIQFQNQHGMLDPKESIRIVSSAMSKLKEGLVSKQTQLITLSSFMDSNASKIIALKKEIKAIKKQIRQQTGFLLGANKDLLNTIYAKFQWMQLSLKFAIAEYEASQNAFNMAKIEMAKQQDLVIEVSPPNLPDDYEYPKITYDLIELFVGLFILYALIRMAHIIIQEHRD